MQALILDNSPTEPHEHRCTSLRCQARTWTCTRPRCYQSIAQPSCEVCTPPPVHTSHCRCGCR